MGLLRSPQVTHKFIIGRNLRRLLWNWLVAWVSISTNVKSTHAICVVVSGNWGCKKWPRDHVWVVRQKHCKCQGNQTVFFFISYKILLTVLNMSQHWLPDKVNKMFALKNRSNVGFIAYSRLLLYCIVRISHQNIRWKEYDVLGLFVTLF